MKDLPLHALRALAVVRSSGGLRAAGRELGVAHSAVSRHLGELEAWLGVPVRARESGRRRLTLTPDGERLAEAALRGLREIESVVASLREHRSARSVLVGTWPSFAARWLLPRLPALERSHPHLEVSVIVEKRLAVLDSGGLDVAVVMGEGPWRGLDAEPLADDALYPVMSPDHWRRVGRPSAPEDLVGLRLLHDRDPLAAWEVWAREHGPAGLEADPAWTRGPRFTSTDLVLRAAAQGQGVALALHRLAAEDVASGLLVRPLGDLSVRLPTVHWIVRAEGAPRREAVETLVRWLRREVSAQPGPDTARRASRDC